MNLRTLEDLLPTVWDAQTSYTPGEWTPENPALGQCAVTALVAQDYLGGNIIWSLVVLPDKKEISHYFNHIDGTDVDLTKRQFPEGTRIPKGREARTSSTTGKKYESTRAYLLSSPTTKHRYELLKKRIEEARI